MKNNFESISSLEQPTTIGYSFSEASERHPERNEDCFISDPKNNLYAVFDGVGGNYGGSEASQFASSIIQRYSHFPESESLEVNRENFFKLLNYAQERLLSAREKYPKFQEMDTTATVVKILKTEGRTVALSFNIGDSRLYSYRQNRNPPLKLHTLDDGVIKEEYCNNPKDVKKTREEARNEAMRVQEEFDSLKRLPRDTFKAELFNKRNLITNSIATIKSISVTVIDVQEGDILLLTTDGIHDPLTRQEILDTVSRNGRDINQIPRQLVERAQRPTYGFRRKSDDRTAVVVKIG